MMASECAETCRSINNIITDINLLCFFDFRTLYLYVTHTTGMPQLKTQISNFTKIRPVGAELFHAEGLSDRRTERHDEANSRFSQFCERASKYSVVSLHFAIFRKVTSDLNQD